MDNLERAGRILAQAFGHGSSWHADKDFGTARAWNRETGERTRRVKLGGTIEADIPEMGDSLPIRREVRLSSDSREAPINGVRELKRWSGERTPWNRQIFGPHATAVTPKVDTSARAMIALAGLDKPLQAILQVYALTDGRHWPTVERYARAALPKSAHAGIAEAMFRVLVHASHRDSAKRLRMRETDYKDMIRPALALFDRWLWRAADEFIARYGDAKRLQDRIDRLSA